MSERSAQAESESSRPLVALAGHPNTGKTTLFNALTGSRARVGNYPGITVERRVGEANLEGVGPVDVVDIPAPTRWSRARERNRSLLTPCWAWSVNGGPTRW